MSKTIKVALAGAGAFGISILSLDTAAALSERAYLDLSTTFGSTASVSSVAVTRPPTTTVASGRWTSLPGACDSAIGRNPSDAIRAVVSTGRSRSRGRDLADNLCTRGNRR